MTNWNALPGDIYIYVYIFGIIFKIENNKCNGFINKKKKNASQRTHPYFSFKLLSQIFRRHFRYELFGFGFSTFSNTFYSILYTEWNIRLILPWLIYPRETRDEIIIIVISKEETGGGGHKLSSTRNPTAKISPCNYSPWIMHGGFAPFSSKPCQSLAWWLLGYATPPLPSSHKHFPFYSSPDPVPPRHPPHRALMYDLMLVSRVDRGERGASRLGTVGGRGWRGKEEVVGTGYKGLHGVVLQWAH